MSKKSGNVLLSAEQKLELGLAMVKAIPWDASPTIAQKAIGSRFLKSWVRQLLMPAEPEKLLAVLDGDSVIGKFAEGWEKHYLDEYGIHADFSGVYVPIHRLGFDRLTFVLRGLTCNQVFAKCESMFPSWRWTADLDAAVKGRNNREPDRHYAIWTRGGQEPDDIKLTANQTAAIGLSGTTLFEELLSEPKWFKETKEHRNIKNVTRCDGSRNSDGYVPGVDWSGSKFRVSYYNPDYPSGYLRPRVAVS